MGVRTRDITVYANPFALKPFGLDGKRVWVAGHNGMVGSALIRSLAMEPIADILTATSSDLDLRRQDQTEDFVRGSRPDVILMAAGRVGGIHANQSAQGQFLYENLAMAANTIEAARQCNVEKFVMLGSSCIYPREATQPIREEELLSGPLEPTNEGYAIAKIAALQLTKMYRRQYGMNAISLMPTNLYGPNDNFSLKTSHVLPSLIRKIHEAKVRSAETVELWGSGRPLREFLHVDDLADATILALKTYEGESHINIGCGEDISIRDLAHLIGDVVGWTGEFVFDTSMPDGTPRKLLDVGRLKNLGWSPKFPLRQGIAMTYEWFLKSNEALVP